MFLLPLSTDAPVYHFPWVTLLFIGVNTAVFSITSQMESADVVPWCLQYGVGLRPLQWVTSNFLHAGIFHLLGNMLALWVFGLIVEGKLGWWKFGTLYLLLGAVQAALEQCSTFWFAEGAALGASGAIFGLMAISLVWAPVNELQCLIVLGYRIFMADLSVRTFCMIYLGLNFVFAAFSGFAVSSELLHLIGAALGLVAGIALLKLGTVDCENWDLFAVMSGTEGVWRDRRKGRNRLAVPPEDHVPIETKKRSRSIDTTEPLARLREALKTQNAFAALQEFLGVVRANGRWDLPEPELLALADLFHAHRHFEELVPLLENYLSRFQKKAVPVRLRLAQVLIETQQRPNYAIRVLEPLGTDDLAPQFQAIRKRLLARAAQMQEDGVVELQGRAW